ncbi:non-ribosomal peptide synthetase [Streptomyces lavendofoliae]|uniref:non-ribosomal peptide synthetase n=1 Tax=Streptomyces lavendofoliae TaxID=67314 RepID=UPI003D919790
MNRDTTSQQFQETDPLLPSDRPRRPGVVGACTAVVRGDVAGPVADGLLLAAFAAVLHRHTGQGEFRIGVSGVTDRPAGTARIRITEHTTTAELADRITHGEYDAGPAPVVTAELGPDGAEPDGRPGELRLVVDREAAGTHRLALHHDPAVFDAATAARLLGHYRSLLADALAVPERPVARLRLLTHEELHRTLVEWNDTSVHLPGAPTLHEAFEAWAERSPDASALVHGDTALTFRSIDRSANRLAHHLRDLGVGRDTRVGICLDRSPDLLIALLGVLKAGGAYVPLDPAYPAERLATMAAGVECAVMISTSGLSGNLPTGLLDGRGQATPLVLLDRDADAITARSDGSPRGGASPDDLCYIIFTSGSTGVPKPIALRHRGVVNNVADLNSRYEVAPGDKVLALSSPSFDMSVYEFLGITAAGGCVVLPDQGLAKDPAHWYELLRRHEVTVWNSAPALLELLVEHVERVAGPAEGGLQLRLAMLGGDWIPVTLPDRVRTAAPGLRFVALGGATESSIHSTVFEVEKTDPEWTSIPYGRPMANQRTYILDENRLPVPVGVPGELYLAGTGLARGYLGQPERTAERFVDWAYEWSDGSAGGRTEDRLYRTGDLARFGPEGLIELLGRTDFQVKIHGLRVELGEIEAHLRRHPDLKDAVVVARSEASGERQLVGYVVARDGVEPDPAALRSHLSERLPAYMVPSVVHALDSLPLTANGKVDRRALPDPAAVPAPGVASAPHGGQSTGDAPAGYWELRIASVWQELLGADRVSRDDDFFALGGDSMKAIRSMPRIDPGLRWGDMYRHSTVRALAEHLRTTVGEPSQL